MDHIFGGIAGVVLAHQNDHIWGMAMDIFQEQFDVFVVACNPDAHLLARG